MEKRPRLLRVISDEIEFELWEYGWRLTKRPRRRGFASGAGRGIQESGL